MNDILIRFGNGTKVLVHPVDVVNTLGTRILIVLDDVVLRVKRIVKDDTNPVERNFNSF